jgi:hypothetical protein
MNPGFHVEGMSCDLHGAPSHRAAEQCRSAWSEVEDLRTSTLVAVMPTTPHHLWVSLLRTDRPGRGLGGAVLKALCAACDEHDVVVELKAHVMADRAGRPREGLDQASLVAFYERRGFETVRGRNDGRMLREPAPSRAMRPNGPCASDGDRATLLP